MPQQAMHFGPGFPKGRQAQPPQSPPEHLHLFKACDCYTTTGSHTHAKFLVLTSALHKLCKEMVSPTILLFLFDIMTRLADVHKSVCFIIMEPSIVPPNTAHHFCWAKQKHTPFLQDFFSHLL